MIDTCPLSQWRSNAIAWIENNPAYDNYDWGRFDLRANHPNYNSNNSTSTPDHVIDYVYFVFRNLDGFSGTNGVGQHIVTTNYSGTTETFYIEDGHTALHCYNSYSHHWIFYKHEFAHNLYTSAHYLGANNTDGAYYYQGKGWGLITAWHQQWDVANAWESWWLGWIEPQEIAQNGIYTIEDLVTTGDAIRIPIPNTDQQYLWIENHRKIQNYPFNGYYFDNKAYYDPPPVGTGLYMYVTAVCDDRSDPGEMDPTDLFSSNFIKPLNAQGNFDFYCDSLYINVPNAGQQPVFGRMLENPIAGQNTYQWIRWDKNGNGYINVAYTHGNWTPPFNDNDQIWAEYLNGIPTPTYANTGLESDDFNVGDEIGLSGIVPVLNYPVYDTSSQTLSPYILNGLSIKVLANNNGVYTLDVKFDDVEVREDKRWCGDIHVPVPPVGKQYSVDILPFKKITLDESATPNREDPINGKFVNPTVMTCLDNSIFHLQEYAELEIINGSTVVINEGGNFEIEDNCTIIMQDEGGFTVDEGGTLSIGDNVTFLVISGSCSINIAGNLQIGSGVQFLADEGADIRLEITNPVLATTLNGVTFERGLLESNQAELNLYDCYFNVAGGVVFSDGDMLVDNCQFDGARIRASGAYEDGKSVTITNGSSFADCSEGVYIADYPEYTIENCTFTGCANAIRIYYNAGCGGQCGIYGNLIEENTYGIDVYDADADIEMNYISQNHTGIRCMNNSNVKIEGNKNAVYVYETQRIENNDYHELYATEGSFPYLLKANAISDDDPNHTYPLIYYTSEDLLDVELNYWGTNFDPELDFYPAGCFDYDPQWYLIPFGGGGEGGEELYSEAQEKILQGDYTGAKADLLQVVDQYPQSKYTPAAMKTLYPLERNAGNNYFEMKNYYRTNSVITSDTNLAKLGDFLGNFCDISLENWPTAIAWFENVIQNPPSLEDSIFAIIDLSYTYFLMQNGGYKATYTGAMPQYKFETYQQYEKNRDDLLALLMPQDNMSKTFRNGLSALQGGKLLQNVPNPFNGRTDIYYKLDYPSDVSIKIYNLMGQMVCELNEGAREVGTYRTTFDATGMPSGMYYYSLLVSGRVTDSKKMLID